MSNIPITSLPIAVSLTGEEAVPLVQAGTTKRTTTGAISALPIGQGTANSGISFITVTSSFAALPNSRTLAGASPVTITDNGTGNTIVVGLSFTPGSGTVTSVGLSGGTTGLTISNSPITTNGTMTLGGYLNGTAIATASITATQIAASTITSTQIATNTIGFSKIQQAAGLSVIGVAGASPAVIAPIVGSANQALRVNSGGTALEFGTVPIGTISGLGTGVATFLAAPSSANLATAVTGETGSGALVFGTTPSLTFPTMNSPYIVGGGVTPQGRLTLTTSVSVTTTDVTGATTLYYTPHIGRIVPIYDGANFYNRDIGGELSQTTTDATKSPAAVANNSVYDIFVWNDAGTIRATRGPAWSSDTDRGTGAGTSQVQQIQGIWVNSVAITNGPGALVGTLVGSVRSNGSAQLTDSILFRWVSNAYNDVPRSLSYQDTGANHNYTTATIRQWNGTTSAQIDMLFTLSGGLLTATSAANSTNTGTGAFSIISIGIDSTSVNSAQMTLGPSLAVANLAFNNAAFYTGYPGMGRHFAAMQEYSAASGTTTWVGGSGGLIFPGISGEINN